MCKICLCLNKEKRFFKHCSKSVRTLIIKSNRAIEFFLDSCFLFILYSMTLYKKKNPVSDVDSIYENSSGFFSCVS